MHSPNSLGSPYFAAGNELRLGAGEGAVERGRLVLDGGAEGARERCSLVMGAACRVVVSMVGEGSATTGYEECLVGAIGVVARRFGKVGGDLDGTVGGRTGVAGDHAAAVGRKAGDEGGIPVEVVW